MTRALIGSENAPEMLSAREAAAAESAATGPHDSLSSRLSYSVAEAALITGLSRDLLHDQMRVGKLNYLKVGRRRIITRQHLEAFLSGAALRLRS